MLFLIECSYVMWLLFLAVMALRWKWNTLPVVVKVLAAPLVLFMIVADALFNVTIGTLIFLDLPRHYLFTQRIAEYKQGGGWRAPVACWICANMLDPFEIGGHCHA